MEEKVQVDKKGILTVLAIGLILTCGFALYSFVVPKQGFIIQQVDAGRVHRYQTSAYTRDGECVEFVDEDELPQRLCPPLTILPAPAPGLLFKR